MYTSDNAYELKTTQIEFYSYVVMDNNKWYRSLRRNREDNRNIL